MSKRLIVVIWQAAAFFAGLTLVVGACGDPGAGRPRGVDDQRRATDAKKSAAIAAPRENSAADALTSIPSTEPEIRQLIAQHGYGRAEALARELIDALESACPGDAATEACERLAVARGLLGEILYDLGRPDEAEQRVYEAAVWYDAHGSNDVRRGLLASLYGACLMDQGRYEAAESGIVGGYEILRERLGADDPATLQALQRVVQFFDLWGRPDTGRQFLERHYQEER